MSPKTPHITTRPYSILAVAPFSPALETTAPPVISVDSLSLDQAMEELRPSLDIPVDKVFCPDGSISLVFTSLADFRPKSLLKNVPFLNRIQSAQKFLRNGGTPSQLLSQFPDLAPFITLPPSGPPSEKAGAAAKQDTSSLDDILSMVATDQAVSAPAPAQGQDVLGQLGCIRETVLHAIFTNPEFRRMEAAWSGAKLVCRQVPSGAEHPMNITLVPLPKGDILSVIDHIESAMADAPPNLVLLDREFGATPRDMAVLERLMECADALLAPVVFSVGPRFLGIESWAEIDKAGFIPSRLEGAEYGRWNTLREWPSAGWMVPCCPGIMARAMHTDVAEREPLMMSACWGVGALCAKSLATLGRPTRFSDRATVFLEGLSLWNNTSPLENLLDTSRLSAMQQAGILPLASVKERDQVFAVGSKTLSHDMLPFRLFLSLLITFLMQQATTRKEEYENVETDLAKAIGLFVQDMGIDAPEITVTAHGNKEGLTPLEIRFSHQPEIIPDPDGFTFGFNW